MLSMISKTREDFLTLEYKVVFFIWLSDFQVLVEQPAFLDKKFFGQNL